MSGPGGRKKPELLYPMGKRFYLLATSDANGIGYANFEDRAAMMRAMERAVAAGQQVLPIVSGSPMSKVYMGFVSNK
jgi:hypothetical protein